MIIDGEYRTAFIADEHPDLQLRHRARSRSTTTSRTATAAATSTGNIIGIPKRQREPGARRGSWSSTSTTDDHALVTLSNGLRNVPTTASSAKSPELKPEPEVRRRS